MQWDHIGHIYITIAVPSFAKERLIMLMTHSDDRVLLEIDKSNHVKQLCQSMSIDVIVR